MSRLPLRPWDDHSIQARVLVLQGTSWLVGVLLVSLVAWGALGAAHEEVTRGRRAVASLAARQVDRGLASELAALQRLSGDPQLVHDGGTAAMRAVYAGSALWTGTAIVDPRGAVRVREPAGIDVQPVAASVVEAFATGRPTFTHNVDGAHRLVLVPLRDTAGASAALAVGVMDVPSPALGRLLELGDGDRRLASALVDGDGRLVAAAAGWRALDTRTLASRVAARQSWTGTHDSHDVTLAPLGVAPWAVVIAQPVGPLALTASSIARRLLWLAPLGLALGALFAWGTARSVRQPVALLTSAAERMAGGDLATPMPALPGDEIGRLGRVLEHVRQALGASVEAIAAANERLEQQVRDRTQELAMLCDRLEHRDRWRGEVLHRVISAQEDERRRLARELHDDICQALAALSVSLGAALEGVTAPEARQRLAAVGALVDRSLADLHRMIYDLRPSILDDLGLVPALRWLAQEHLARHGTAVRCEFEGLERRLPPEVETAVFRVVQEALMNVERHARAETVLVQAALVGARLTVEIEDDGRGFEPASMAAPTPQGRGLGLLGMRERVELLGGSLIVDSAPGQGTRVVVAVPVGTSAADEARRSA